MYFEGSVLDQLLHGQPPIGVGYIKFTPEGSKGFYTLKWLEDGVVAIRCFPFHLQDCKAGATVADWDSDPREEETAGR